MGLARLLVIDGPDLGCEFDVPLRGGAIGRGEGSAVQLSDLAVSRHHCTIEWSGGQFVLVDAGSRNRTLVNGKRVARHVLSRGDEIAIGKTRLSFLPADVDPAAMRQALPSRVTMEVGSGELLRAAEAAAGRDQRAARHLASLAELGQRLRELADQTELATAACDAARGALGAERAFHLVAQDAGDAVPIAGSATPGSVASARLELAPDAVAMLLAEGKAIALEDLPGARVAMAAPLYAPGGPSGILYADRPAGSGDPWDRIDLCWLGCLAHLVSASAVSLEVREALARENRELSAEVSGGEFIGQSAEARAALATVAKVGPTDATVLLTGESGSGKEMVARAIHRASRRSSQPFVAVNCAALTESLIESELFGHEKGAFTGATERKIGRFEAAHCGTLFLDEVGELPLGCQTKFLRVLEEQTFERVGGTRPVAVDVRVIAATNRDLGEMVRLGGFREDLYYRLSVIHAVVPPLRARPGDIPILAEHFLARLRRRVPRRVTGFSADAMSAMVAHPWPGNVRELRNAVERALVLGEGPLVRHEDLPPPLSSRSASRAPAPASPAPFAATAPAATPSARSLRELEREGIIAALSATGGNKVQAATILEIDRSTLYKKIKDYGIGT
jgi:DNA-binding NtrC family response regulator